VIFSRKRVMATSLRVEDRLDGATNFGAWKERMILLLQENELWDIVENTTTHPVVVPTDATLLAAYTKKSIKAKRFILDAIKDHLIPHLTEKTHAYEMWESLTKLYQSTNENRKMVLREKLKSIKMTKAENVVTYLTRLTQVRDELGAVGEAIADSDLVRTALNGVSKQWVVFVEGIVAREKLPGWERLWDDFVQEETRRGYVHGSSSTGHEEENVALATTSKKKFRKGPKGGQKPKGEGKKDMSKVKCFACHKFGHYAGQCPNKKKKQTTASAEVEEFSTKFDKEFSLIECLSSRNTTPDTWYIDSGASRHMTAVREHLTDLTQCGDAEVVLGDDREVKVASCGTVSFRRESLPPMTLTEVLYVLGLNKNLVSVSTIEEKGYEVLFRDGQVLLFPRGSSITSAKVIGTRHERLYKFLFQLVQALIHSTSSSSDLCEIWHRRMAHLHHGALRVLREMVTGVPNFSSEHHELCKGCTLGKYTKTTFSSSDSRAVGILELIHSDVCGPMSSTSLTGSLYYVVFIDDFSRKSWIFFMKTKGQVFSQFQEFKALVENQTGKKIRVLRSNNGGEYTSKEFMDFCAGEGIKRELTVPYNPQQNGVAERKNRAIVGAARAMLHDQGLPLFLWVEACYTAVYLQNRSPHGVVGSMTPEEAFSGKKPEVGHFRIFGCITYSYVPSEKRTKMEPMAERGIFVGYSETSKAFCIYLPSLRKTVLRRDVIFEEDGAYRKSRGTERGDQSSPQIQVNPQQTTVTQSSRPPTSVTTGSQVTGPQSSGSQATGPQISRSGTSRSTTRSLSSANGVEQGESPPQDTSSERRKPKWLQDTLREAQCSVGNPRQAVRESKPPERFCSYIAMVSSIRESEPSTFEEATSRQVWRDAMIEEYNSIMKNDVWEVVPRPEGKSVVTSRWLYKLKHAAEGSIEKYKARFVARGFSQVEGVDYDETFALVARYTLIRAVISIAAKMGWKIHEMDVKTAFLNGLIEEEVYIEQPLGFEVHGRESHVCRLKKALYGLKQAPIAWYSRIDAYLQQLGFEKSEVDPNLYFIVVGEDPLILLLCVDDLFITGAKRLISSCKESLASEFEMTDIGLMYYFLGLEVWQEPGHIFLGQGKYVCEILSRFQMGDSRPMTTPMITNWKKLHAFESQLVDSTLYHQLIGSLMYLVNTRPDICFAVNTLSQFMVEPRRGNWVAAKHVLKYLCGTVDYGLDYHGGDGVRPIGYTDSDWAGCVSDKKSTSGCCFGLGSVVVSWFNRKQKSGALSSAEAEYMVASQASCEALWLRKMLVVLFGAQLRPTVIYCDNQSCIKLSKNPVFHDWSKHIEIRYHFIRDFREELWSYSTYLQRSRLQTYSPRHWAEASLYFSGTSLEW
jgi:hypothetical protein